MAIPAHPVGAVSLKDCDQVALRIVAGDSESAPAWRTWSPRTGKLKKTRPPKLIPLPSAIDGPYPSERDSYRSFTSPDGTATAKVQPGIPSAVLVIKNGSTRSLNIEEDPVIFGWLDDFNLVVSSHAFVDGEQTGRGNPGYSKLRIIRVSETGLEEKWGLGTEQNQSPRWLKPNWIEESNHGSRLYFSSDFQGSGRRSVGIEGDIRTEDAAPYSSNGMSEIDGRFLVSGPGRLWFLRDRQGQVVPLTDSKDEALNERAWLSLSPDGATAALLRNDRVTIWNRKDPRRKRELFQRAFVHFPGEFGVSGFNTRRHGVEWMHGGLVLYGNYGASYITHKFEVFNFGKQSDGSFRTVDSVVQIGPGCSPKAKFTY